ncbi:DUF4240 domain-containing protein [Flavobacterium commune]|nr:DUF4240 domain-containing protein [Flavobacterium commune]
MKQIFLILMPLFLILLGCKKMEQTEKTKNMSNFIKVKSNIVVDTIKTDKFWTIIGHAVKESKGNDDLKEQILISELKKLSLVEIKNFEFAFRKCIIDADEFKIMAAMKIIEGYVSDDSYLYFRCWLIGQGKTIFQETLKNPDYLTNVVNQDKIHEFEGLMYVATKAYEIKSGKKEDESFPRNEAGKIGLDYDFGAPPTKGVDWTEDELPNLLPKLYSKYND